MEREFAMVARSFSGRRFISATTANNIMAGIGVR
jgi:hypothetical protein